ncbi:MAG: ATPase, partial [Actinobacteria bacterium]|nr:ATPase [Actinomycetota bacterium]
LGDRAAASAHFAAAAAAARSLGAAPLAARIDAEARQAAADELAGPAAAGLARPAGGDRARQAAGKPSWPEPAVTSQSGPAETSRPGPAVTSRPGPAEASPAAVFRRETDVWQLAYQGREVRLRDSKGLRDIAILLARPGSAVAALDLAAVPPGGPARPGRPEPGELHQPADTGELLDPQARQAYRQRLRELAEEADQADAAADAGRSAKIAAEREFLVAALTEAYGLGGRVRRAGSPAERARTAVTARIKDAIRRIGAAHPALGRHLSRSVRTGTFCSYEPEQPVSWQL